VQYCSLQVLLKNNFKCFTFYKFEKVMLYMKCTIVLKYISRVSWGLDRCWYRVQMALPRQIRHLWCGRCYVIAVAVQARRHPVKRSEVRKSKTRRTRCMHLHTTMYRAFRKEFYLLVIAIHDDMNISFFFSLRVSYWTPITPIIFIYLHTNLRNAFI